MLINPKFKLKYAIHDDGEYLFKVEKPNGDIEEYEVLPKIVKGEDGFKLSMSIILSQFVAFLPSILNTLSPSRIPAS